MVSPTAPGVPQRNEMFTKAPGVAGGGAPPGISRAERPSEATAPS